MPQSIVRFVMSMKIAVVADEDTGNCFRLAGLQDVYSIKSAEEADRLIREFSEQSDFAVIVTSDAIANQIRSTINEITEKNKFPLIISIQNLGGAPQGLFDPITELIKRKTGIELKL
jgi:V/A-type H+-transporting ATPase subunit F